MPQFQYDAPDENQYEKAASFVIEKFQGTHRLGSGPVKPSGRVIFEGIRKHHLFWHGSRGLVQEWNDSETYTQIDKNVSEPRLVVSTAMRYFYLVAPMLDNGETGEFYPQMYELYVYDSGSNDDRDGAQDEVLLRAITHDDENRLTLKTTRTTSPSGPFYVTFFLRDFEPTDTIRLFLADDATTYIDINPEQSRVYYLEDRLFSSNTTQTFRIENTDLQATEILGDEDADLDIHPPPEN